MNLLNIVLYFVGLTFSDLIIIFIVVINHHSSDNHAIQNLQINLYCIVGYCTPWLMLN